MVCPPRAVFRISFDSTHGRPSPLRECVWPLHSHVYTAHMYSPAQQQRNMQSHSLLLQETAIGSQVLPISATAHVPWSGYQLVWHVRPCLRFFISSCTLFARVYLDPFAHLCPRVLHVVTPTLLPHLGYPRLIPPSPPPLSVLPQRHTAQDGILHTTQTLQHRLLRSRHPCFHVAHSAYP